MRKDTKRYPKIPEILTSQKQESSAICDPNAESAKNLKKSCEKQEKHKLWKSYKKVIKVMKKL